MKKTLVAIAALAAFGAQAQSTVTLTGNIDLGAQRFDVKGKGFTNSGAANGSSTSAFVFAGTEDMGGGLTANFRLEIDPDLANTAGKTAGTPAVGTTSNVTSSLSNGYSFLGLKSATLGEVQFGTLNYATLSAHGDGNSGFSTAIGSGYRVTSFDAVRGQNGASYETPQFAGLSAKVIAITKNAVQSGGAATGNSVNQVNGRDGAQEISLAYANGPLTARYAELTTTQDAGYNTAAATVVAGPGGEFKLKTFSATYAIGAGSIGFFNQTASSDVLKASSAAYAITSPQYDRKTNGISGKYAVTPVITLMANYQKVTIGTEAAVATVATVNGASTTVKGLGVDYMLSKRTVAYFRTETDNDNAIVRAVTGYGTNAAGTYKATAVGIRHAF
jgi:predicted porin